MTDLFDESGFISAEADQVVQIPAEITFPLMESW